GHKNFEFINGDILDFDLMKRACDHVSCVFHLAADSRIQTGISDPLHAFRTNIQGTANVAEAARQMGVQRIVYSASSSAYGRRNDWIFKTGPEHGLDQAVSSEEGWTGGLNERLPTDCLNPYSMSKKAGEDIMDVYHRLYGMSTVSLRYFNVYGPRHQEEGRYATVIAIFRRQLRHGQKMTIVGDGTQRRDFTFVGDVVRANMMAMMNHEATGVFNVGTGTNYSINELSRLVSGKTATEDMTEWVEYIPPRLGEAQVTLADITKISDVMGWRPQVNLQQGLEVLDMFEKKVGLPSGIILSV
ncbi:MAG: NAD-dependent epimerase/dehydratase family protein, partial [Thermomicrobiales bacterium]